ncbi:MAG: hypothetical protein R3E98_09005 [Gemmatimonadota bacterium]|nr:hypothetical protein [Gemmatimonadota bacterium]
MGRKTGKHAGILAVHAAAAALVACGGTPEAAGPTPGHAVDDRIVCAPADTPSRFRFRNGVWLNLHNFLFLQAKRARGIHDESAAAAPGTDAEALALRTLSREERAIWDTAVATYVDRVLPHTGMSNPVLDVNERIAGAGSGALPSTLDPALRATLEAALPVYLAVWWPRHEAHNAGWIAEMQSLLDRYEACLGPRLATALGTVWADDPIPVDASVYASWYGAYSVAEAPHITMATTAVGNRGLMGLEGLLHEAGHVAPQRLSDALATAGDRQGRAVPQELAHLLLFYTAGELVWRAVPGHPGYARAYGIWEQNERARRFREVLAREWRPWLYGERSFEDALHAVVAEAPTLASTGAASRR